MRRFYTISAILILQFILVSALAMILYDGGNRFGSADTGYMLLRNTFSDLGRAYGFDGEPKALTRWLFTISLTVGAAAFAGYHLSLPWLFSRVSRITRGGITMGRVTTGHDERGNGRGTGARPDHRRRSPRRQRVAVIASGVGAVTGAVTGIAFIAIAALPADLFPERHFIAVYIAFSAFLPGAVAVVVAIVVSPDYPSRYALFYLILGLSLAAYLILIYFGPPISSPRGSVIQITGQKLMVYIGTLCIGAQAWATSLVSGRLRREVEAYRATVRA